MTGPRFLNGNEAVAWGVKLARPQVVSAYPITPQTKAVERIAQFVQDGDLDCQYLHVESEHSALACAMGASAVGVRTFTATASQGLLYMAECLPYAAGARLPIVMMNANRSVATPWNIYGDQMDVMFVLNAGWVQLFAESGQEALDLVLQSFRLAEDPRIMAPVMLNLDGFVLTHTYEKILVPDAGAVDAFLPPFAPQPHMMTDEHPMSMAITAGNQHNMEFKMRQHRDLLRAEAVFEEIDGAFGDAFGRRYGGAVEPYRTEDADAVVVATGSVCGTVRHGVDELRREGRRVGMIKLRMLRPFPAARLAACCPRHAALGVLDRNISFGYEGTVCTNVKAALLRHGGAVQNFVGGLGGRDITLGDVREMFGALEHGPSEAPGVSYLHARCRG